MSILDDSSGAGMREDVASDYAPELEQYLFELYVSGNAHRSSRAIANLRALCEKFVPGRYRLNLIDIAGAPAIVRREHIIAAPTLVRRLPLPTRRFIGDLSRTEHVLVGSDDQRVVRSRDSE